MWAVLTFIWSLFFLTQGQKEGFCHQLHSESESVGEGITFGDAVSFCQLENRMTADKYKGSYERCAKVVSNYSQNAGLDIADLFLRIVFSYAVGNSDMHLKNFSLIETEEGSGVYHLSEAYDMLPVNVIMPQDREQLALTLNGKKQNIRRRDFLVFADSCGINPKSAEKMIGKIISLKDTYIQMCRESYLPDDMKDRFECLVCERVALLN